MKQINLILCFLAGISLTAQQNVMEKIVKVTALAEKQVSPDEVIFSIDMNQKEATFEAALNALDKVISETKSILIKAKIDENQIKTTAYNVRKNYFWDKGKRRDDGFMATSRLEAKNKLDTRIINRVLAQFAKESPELNLNVTFSISDELLERSKDELLSKALHRASSKAEIICAAIGKKLKDIKSVEYSEVGARPVYQKSMVNASAMRMSVDAEHAPVENVKEIKLSLSVYTEWIIN